MYDSCVLSRHRVMLHLPILSLKKIHVVRVFVVGLSAEL